MARHPDKGRDARLTAYKRTRFAELTPNDFAAVNNARVLDTYRFISAHVALPCPVHGQPLDDEQVGQAIDGARCRRGCSGYRPHAHWDRCSRRERRRR